MSLTTRLSFFDVIKSNNFSEHTTKHSTDGGKTQAKAMLAIKKNIKSTVSKQKKKRQWQWTLFAAWEHELKKNHGRATTKFSTVLGKLLTVIRVSTNGGTIGGPLTAYVLMGNDIFALRTGTKLISEKYACNAPWCLLDQPLLWWPPQSSIFHNREVSID